MRLVLALLLTGLILALSGCGGCTCYSYDPVNSTVYPGLATTSTTPVTVASLKTTTTPPTTAPSTTTSGIVIDLPSTSDTSELETTTSTEKLSSAETRLSDGRIKAMGFIKKVWESGGKRYISIDYAEYLTGNAAVQAAIADGVIQPGQALSNGYYIRNTNPQTRDFEVSPKALITTNSWSYMDRGITWVQFKSLWSSSPPDGAGRLKHHPWWIEREESVIMNLEEPYLL